jgi:hypothetical protein
LSRTLKNLINHGLIEYRGAKKTGGYFLKKWTEPETEPETEPKTEPKPN